MKLVFAATALFLLAACSGAGVKLKVSGTLPHPVFEVTGGLGGAPCLTQFRVGPSQVTSVSQVAHWSIRRPKGCLKPALVLYGNMPEGFVDKFPSEEGATDYRPVHWPAELKEGSVYLVTIETEGGRKSNFRVEFTGGAARVSRG